MFCNKCGKEINNDSIFCNFCGNNLNNSKTTNKKKNNKAFKKYIIISFFLLIITLLVILFIESRKISVPNVYGIDENTAKTILQKEGFITNTQYSFDNKITENSVINTIPAKNTKVTPYSIITLNVSKGKKIKTEKAQDAIIEWFHISQHKEDLWEFETPIKEGNYITISCTPTFSKNFSWRGTKTEGFGIAAINDTFDKSVPVKIIYEQQDVKSNIKSKINLKIPTQDLDTQKPTNLYLELCATDTNNKDFTIKVNFTISW